MLKNKLGVNDPIELAKEEERLGKTRALQIFDQGLLDGFKPGSIMALLEVHRILFEEIYEFAGKIRTVNLARGNFRFASAAYLCNSLSEIENIPQSSFERIIEKYVEINIAHPFREGNGRAARIWLDHLLKNELKVVIDWSLVDKNKYLQAMERSPVNDRKIKQLLKNALTDQIDDRLLFCKSLDQSWLFEGFSDYRAETL